MEFLSNPAVWGVVGSVITGLIAYQTGLRKDKFDLSKQREAYVTAEIQNLLESYKQEIGDLKREVRELTAQNQKLVVEIVGLKAKIIEMENMQNVKKIN